MKNKLILILFILLGAVSTELNAQKDSAWQIFEKVEFRDVYVEEYLSYASMADPGDEFINSFDGKKLTVKGHYIPVMGDIIIVSKYPYANCFFCGGAGLESIVEVRLKNDDHLEFISDEKLEFTGILKINTTDWQQVSFILEDAELVK
jgi:hypothetical protein